MILDGVVGIPKLCLVAAKISEVLKKATLRLPLVLLFLAILGTAGSFLGIWSSHVERLSHFRFWWIGLLMLLGLLFLRQRRYSWAGVALAGVIAAIWGILPYWLPPASSRGFPDSGRVKIVTWNLLHENTRHEDAFRCLMSEDADVILLSEATDAWREALLTLTRAYPHRIDSGRDGAEGLWLLSRFPMDPPDPAGLVPSEKKPWISTVVHAPVGDFRIIGMHPRTPRSGSRFGERNAQLDRAADISASAGMPVILLGDLNCTPFSPWFRRLLHRGKLRDSALGSGLPATWDGQGIGLPIDHILLSDHWRVGKRWVQRDKRGSDHSPVSALLSLQSAR